MLEFYLLHSAFFIAGCAIFVALVWALALALLWLWRFFAA